MIQLNELLENPQSYAKELESPLPFLFPNNDMAKAQWHLKLQQFQASNQNYIQVLKKSLLKVDLLKSTETRIKKQIEAFQKRETEICALFAELSIKPVQSENIKKLLANRIPSRQHIESYYLNVFRDWCWGETENAHYNKLAEKIDVEKGDFLVLGGGPGRLAYDLCQIYDHWNIVQLDINPLLSLIGQKMAKGERLELTEIATEPLSIELLSETRQLEGLGEVPGARLAFALGDASNPPFKDSAFNGLITPWLIDILPEAFESFSRRMNRILKDGGEWVSFGPLSFEKHKPENQLTANEVLEQLKVAGFDVIDSGWDDVPYLQSPIRAQLRREKIFWFHAKKRGSCKQPPRYHFYPDWFENPEVKPAVASTNIETLFSQKNLEANILQSFVQGLSIKEMIGSLVIQAGMPEDEAESLIIGTVNRLIESGEIVSK